MKRVCACLLIAGLLLAAFLLPNSPAPLGAQEGGDQPPISLENAAYLSHQQTLGPGRALSVEWSPNGERLAIGALNGLWLYNTFNLNAPPRHFSNHFFAASPANAITFRPDGSQVAVGFGSPLAPGGWEVRVFEVATGHTVGWLPAVGAPYGLAWSPDGSTLYSSDEGGFHAWDTSNWQRIRDFTNENIYGPRQMLALSPDGRYLAGAGSEAIASIWDTQTGDMLHQLMEGSFQHSLQFSPDGTQLLAAGLDVRVWDVASGKLVAVGAEGTTRQALSPDGSLVATVTDEGDLNLYTREGFVPFFSHRVGRINDLAWSQDGRFVAVLDDRLGPRLLGVSGEDILPADLIGLPLAPISRDDRDLVGLSYPLGPVLAGRGRPEVSPGGVAWSPDGTQLALFSAQGIWLYEDIDGRMVGTFLTNTADLNPHSVAWNSSSTHLAIGDDTGQLYLLAAATGSLEPTMFHDLAAPVENIRFRGDSHFISWAGGQIIVTPLGEQGFIPALNSPHPTLAISPDGQVAAFVGDNGDIRLWDFETNAVREPAIGQPAIAPLAFNAAGYLLTSGTVEMDGEAVPAIITWNIDTGQQIGAFPFAARFGAGEAVRLQVLDDGARYLITNRTMDGCFLQLHDTASGDLRWSQDFTACHPYGSELSTASGRLAIVNGDGTSHASDGAVEIWAVQAPPAYETLLAGNPADRLRTVALSPDGRQLTLALEDRIRTLDLSTGDTASLAEGLAAPINRLGYSPDGRWLAGGDTLGQVYVWAAATGEQMNVPLQTGGVVVSELAFTPDSQTLITLSPPGLVEMWQVGEDGILVPASNTDIGGEGVRARFALSPDGQTLLATDSTPFGQTLPLLVDLASFSELGTLDPPGFGYTPIGVVPLFSPDGETAILVGEMNTQFWDIPRQQITDLTYEARAEQPQLLLTPGGGYLLVGSRGEEGRQGTVQIYDRVERQALPDLYRGIGVAGMSLSPAGNLLLALVDGEVRRYDLTAIIPDFAPFPAEPLPCENGLTSQFTVGDQGEVFEQAGAPLNLRDNPGVAGSAVIDGIDPGTEFTVIGEPVCVQGDPWVQVRLANGLEGWFVEGLDGLYFLVPLE